VNIDEYGGSDPDAYMEGVINELAQSYCDCTDPPRALLNQFGAVQYQVQSDGSLLVEFTIYSGNPNATASDIADTLEANPPPAFSVQAARPTDILACEDEVNGCNGGSGDSDNTMLFIIIGVASFSFILALGIVWYFVHRRVGRQYKVKDAKNKTIVHVDYRENTAWQS
jgi:hypothetical protein